MMMNSSHHFHDLRDEISLTVDDVEEAFALSEATAAAAAKLSMDIPPKVIQIQQPIPEQDIDSMDAKIKQAHQEEVNAHLNKIRPDSHIKLPKLTIDCTTLQNATPLEQLSAISSALRSPFGSAVFEALDTSVAVAPAAETMKREERVYQCADCEKSFTQQAHLSIHQRKHTGERPFLCPYEGCGKRFTQFGNLKTHERKHTGERPFKCSFEGCGKAFSQMGNMKTHEKLHAGVRPYPCNVSGCTKSFTQLGNLKSHQMKVHPDTTTHTQMVEIEEPRPQPQPPKKRKVDRTAPSRKSKTTVQRYRESPDQSPQKSDSSSSVGHGGRVKSVDIIPQSHLPPRKRKISAGGVSVFSSPPAPIAT